MWISEISSGSSRAIWEPAIEIESNEMENFQDFFFFFQLPSHPRTQYTRLNWWNWKRFHFHSSPSLSSSSSSSRLTEKWNHLQNIIIIIDFDLLSFHRRTKREIWSNLLRTWDFYRDFHIESYWTGFELKFTIDSTLFWLSEKRRTKKKFFYFSTTSIDEHSSAIEIPPAGIWECCRLSLRSSDLSIQHLSKRRRIKTTVQANENQRSTDR